VGEKTIAILGDGGCGTSLALLLDGKGHHVRLWGAFPDYIARLRRSRVNSKYLPGVRLKRSIELTASLPEAVAGADVIVMAVPIRYFTPVAKRLAKCYSGRTPVLSATKGIAERSLKRPSQILRDVLGDAPIAVLSGPMHAEEIARGRPTIVALASRNRRLAGRLQEVFVTPTFRVYTNTDVAGVELGGALKNVIGIAAGMCDGLGLGDNAKSALLTRGLAEIRRLAVRMGARAETFAGLSGIGDLLTTSISPHGRNRRAGEQIGRGRSLREVLASTEMTIEGVWTCKAVHSLARRYGIEMPISEQVYQILFRRKDPRRAVIALMTRLPRSESERKRQ